MFRKKEKNVADSNSTKSFSGDRSHVAFNGGVQIRSIFAKIVAQRRALTSHGILNLEFPCYIHIISQTLSQIH